jgi:predicted transcriptional regulator
MSKVRVEIHLTTREVKVLDKLAKVEDRSRKNFCESVIKQLIDAFLKNQK